MFPGGAGRGKSCGSGRGNIFPLCLRIFSCQRTILFLIFEANVIFILVPWEELCMGEGKGRIAVLYACVIGSNCG